MYTSESDLLVCNKRGSEGGISSCFRFSMCQVRPRSGIRKGTSYRSDTVDVYLGNTAYIEMGISFLVRVSTNCGSFCRCPRNSIGYLPKCQYLTSAHVTDL